MTEYIERDSIDVNGCRSVTIDESLYLLIDDVFDRIATAPAADVEPVVHARWVVDTAWSTPPTRTKCSACGFTELYADYERCPSCGAHMDLKEERK